MSTIIRRVATTTAPCHRRVLGVTSSTAGRGIPVPGSIQSWQSLSQSQSRHASTGTASRDIDVLYTAVGTSTGSRADGRAQTETIGPLTMQMPKEVSQARNSGSPGSPGSLNSQRPP